jgi:hypothetical protein
VLLSNLLVICPNYGGPANSTVSFLTALAANGATVITPKAKADVSLTRCLTAFEAEKRFRACRGLEWLLWLDQDMSATLDDVLMMLAFGGALGTVSGRYCSRHANLIAAWALKDQKVGRPVKALVGMGCLLQRRDSLLAHCDESPRFQYPTASDYVPLVCRGRIATAEELSRYVTPPPMLRVGWLGEDFDYSLLEFDRGRPIYVVAVDFRHEATAAILPPSSAVFPGLA